MCRCSDQEPAKWFAEELSVPNQEASDNLPTPCYEDSVFCRRKDVVHPLWHHIAHDVEDLGYVCLLDVSNLYLSGSEARFRFGHDKLVRRPERNPVLLEPLDILSRARRPGTGTVLANEAVEMDSRRGVDANIATYSSNSAAYRIALRSNWSPPSPLSRKSASVLNYWPQGGLLG